MEGWIKLHRKLLESLVFDNPELLKVWIWCLLKSTHKGYTQLIGLQEVQLKEGQFVFGRKVASKELGMSESKVYRLIKKLEKMQNLNIKSNNKFSVITIEKWGDYQSVDLEGEQQNEQQMNNKRTTNEHKQECKECKEDIIVLTPLENEILKTLSTVENYPLDREKDLDMIKRLEKRYPQLDLVESIKDWATYKLDKPLKKKDNPRSQINTSCKNYVKWGKNLKTNKDFTKKGANDNPYGHLPVYR